MQTTFCDRHPLQEMAYVAFSREGRVETDGFKCPQCNRIYILAGDLGYLDFLNGEMVVNPCQQLNCSHHHSPFYLAEFKLNGDASARTWQCPHGGCHEVKVTIGENYLMQSAA